MRNGHIPYNSNVKAFWKRETMERAKSSVVGVHDEQSEHRGFLRF